jgi:hypothetical protein
VFLYSLPCWLDYITQGHTITSYMTGKLLTFSGGVLSITPSVVIFCTLCLIILWDRMYILMNQNSEEIICGANKFPSTISHPCILLTAEHAVNQAGSVSLATLCTNI